MIRQFRFHRAFAFVIVLFGMAGVGPAFATDWFEQRGVPPPGTDRVYVCHAYTCRMSTPVRFNESDLARLTEPLAAGATDAAAERAALGKVEQIFEEIIGARIGTSGDLAKMQFGQGNPSQMDCIDEATNTASLLRLLDARGLLHHHKVLQPVARGFFIDGRYPHATAVVQELDTGTKWAIDSWPRANAEPPVIQLLSKWRRARSGDPLPAESS
jgi:hypothetical protein